MGEKPMFCGVGASSFPLLRAATEGGEDFHTLVNTFKAFHDFSGNPIRWQLAFCCLELIFTYNASVFVLYFLVLYPLNIKF